MIKKLAVVLVLALAATLLVSAVSAQAPSDYESSIQIQNLDPNTDADILVEFYDASGAVVDSFTDVIPAGGSAAYYPLDVESGFSGSAVISSNVDVAAISNLVADNFAFGSSYGGFAAGADIVSLPLIMRNNGGYNTWFSVQNAGAAATNVTVEFAGQPSCDTAANIAPGAAATFTQADNTCLGSQYVGAATITSDGEPIVATVAEAGPSLFAYNGFTAGAMMPVMPLVQANNSNYHTGIQIQNRGGTDTDVTITYYPTTPDSQASCTETQTVAAGGSKTFALNAFSFSYEPTTTDCVKGSKFVGSAEVTANSAGQPLVGIVNQTDFVDKGSAYNAFDPSAGTDTVLAPLIMDRNSGYFTSITVQNVGTGTADVVCEFDGLDASYNLEGTIGVGESLNQNQINNLTDGYVGSATCTTDSAGGALIGVVNEFKFAGGDQLYSYEMINQ